MKTIGAFVFTILLAGCGGQNSPSPALSPGNAKSGDTRLLESGAELLQDKEPVDLFSTYLDGFHFYSGDISAQMEAHHYVAILSEDPMQAVIFDGNTKGAKLMGVEYIISERLFKELPADEKKLWHCHRYEVASGSLVGPAVDPLADAWAKSGALQLSLEPVAKESGSDGH